jgi:hypothetical protein
LAKLFLLAAVAAGLGCPAFAAERPVTVLGAEMQRLEASRNAAIKAGDMKVLKRIYAPDFHGIAANGARVDRDALFAIFQRNAGGDFVADSEILSAREVGGVIIVEGRLRLYTADRRRLISDSYFLHVFRQKPEWLDFRDFEMVAGSATAAPAS